MMKPFYLATVLVLLFYNLHAQDIKDSIYYSKMSAPGTKMIPVFNGKYKVFTQKQGSGKINLLLLHGGPENTHEYFENFPEQVKQQGVTIYYYDQLGSYFSDTPADSAIWDINRFVEEVEEVRKGLGIDSFYLLGHSWGGMLAELYAAKYGQHLKGLVLSNVPGFFAPGTKQLDSLISGVVKVVSYRATLLPKFKNNKAQIDSISKGQTLADTTANKLLTKQYNKAHDSLVVRTMYYHKTGALPDPLLRNLKHARFESIEKYNFNPFSADYKKALQQIRTPTLIIGAKNDFVYPQGYENLRKVMTHAKVRVAVCPNGAHFTMWDDTENYFREINRFIYEVNKGSFSP